MNLATFPNLSNRRSYDEAPSSFESWLNALIKADSPDKVRSLLYYGFQPLFDALVEGRIRGERRKLALKLLTKIVQFNMDFVSGYYTGGEIPDIHNLSLDMEPLKEAQYRTKSRNIGMYDGDGRDLCTPNHVQQFLMEFYRTVESSILPPPDYVVCCACGSSEVAMAMAAMFQVKVGFIRRSKRRGDDEPLIISEQEARIKQRVKGHLVVVVEDFVCTGRSIHAVMEKVQSFEATRVIGISMARNSSDCLTSKLKIIHTLKGKHGSYAYESKV